LIRELADELRRLRGDLDDLWRDVQVSSLDNDVTAEVSQEIEDAAECVSRALRLFSSLEP
jgi:hypothetical protein